MKTIWKYDLAMADSQVVHLPEGADVLHVECQQGHPKLWALVESTNTAVPRRFRTYGTGYMVDQTRSTYIGTYLFNDDARSFHVFEES